MGPGTGRRAAASGALERVGLAEGASKERLRFVATIEECVADADFIQENAPEREDLKLTLHEKASKAAKPEAIIASSTSGLLPKDFYASTKDASRCIVGHPFNPVYLLPLVEVGGGEKTSEATLQAASAFYESIGMRPLRVRKEVSRVSSRTACWKRSGAKHFTWSTKAWRPRRNRRCNSFWRGHSLVVHGHVPDLYARRRRGRYAAFHAAIRTGAR